MKIDKVYINEGLRIRNTFFSSVEELKKKESTLLKYKNELEDIVKDTDAFVQRISGNKMDEKSATIAMNDHLNDIETSMEKIKDEIRPIGDQIEQLKKDAKILFDSIKEKYPDMSDLDIQKELFVNISNEKIK